MPLPRIVVILLVLAASLASQATPQVDISAPPLRFTSGNTIDIAFGDFDEDGFQDYALNLASSNRIEVWRSDGFEGFELTDTLMGTGRQVEVVDWNGDGHLDLVTGRVSIYFGSGDGTFTLGVDEPSALAAAELTLGRFDDDEHLDVLVSSQGQEAIAILLGDGAGGLLPARVTFAPSPGNIEVGDVNGDNHADLLIPDRRTRALSYWPGDGTGLLPDLGFPLLDSSNAHDARAVDFNGDNHLDFVILEPGLNVAYGDGTGHFESPPTLLTTVINDRTLVVEDFDNDGILDIAIGGRAFHRELTIHIGLGGGNIGPEIYYETPSAGDIESLAAGDVNNDGMLDLVAHVDHFSASLASFLGNGDGTFQEVAIESATPEPARGNAPRTIVLGFFDGDSNLDVATLSQGDMYISFGDGTGGFALAQSFAVDMHHLASADLNGDGFTDLVGAAMFDESVHVFLGSASGTFSALPPVGAGYRCRWLAFGEFNGDTFLDVATANSEDAEGEEISILLNDGTGTLILDVSYPAGYEPNIVASGDWNEDGLADLMAINETTHSTTLFTTVSGPGDFAMFEKVATDNNAHTLALADLDADGDLDAAVSGGSGTTSILRGNGLGGFAVVQQLATGTSSRSLDAVDLDGDDRIDLVVKNEIPGEVAVHRNEGPSGFSPAIPHPVAISSDRARLGDITNDGILDITALALGSFDRIVTLEGDGAGGFATLEDPITLAFEPDDLEKADIDGNGTLDIIAAQGRATTLTYFKNDGFGIFERLELPSSSGPVEIATGFFNGDSFEDFAAACEDGDRVTTYLGNATVPSLRRDFPVGSAPKAVATGDFDEDGHTDLVVANSGSDSATLLFGDGVGGFSPETLAGDLFEPRDVIVGQFDDLLDPDGHLDLAFVNSGADAVVVLTGDGTGNFGNAAAFPVTLEPWKIATDDFDRDGHLDIVVTALSGATQIFFGTGFGTFPDATSLPASGTTVELADVNRDGRNDILLTNNERDVLHVVLANATRTPSSVFSFALDNPSAVVGGNFDDERDVDVVVGTAHLGPLRLLRNQSFDPLRCRAGNVNDLVGARAETLTVNGSIGAPRREVAVDSTDSIRVALERAPTPAAGSRYYVGVWAGPPTSDTTARVPALIGYSCFQMIRNQPDYLMPIEVANTIRPTDPRLDPPSGTATGNPVPGDVLVIPPGLAPGTVLTVQGILGDGGTSAAKPVSLTNAVVVTVE